MEETKKTYTFIIIATILCIFLFIILLMNVIFKKETDISKIDKPLAPTVQKGQEITFAPSPIVIEPLEPKNVPTLESSKGIGLDTNSEIASESAFAINRLNEILPYQRNLRFFDKEVSIYVPNSDLQDNVWSLTVHIDGINYMIKKDDPNYQKEKGAFLSSANDVFSLIKSVNIEPEKVIITWGDKNYIHERSKAWLKGEE